MYESFNPLALLLLLLSLQQACCVPQQPSNNIEDPHCSNDVESWGTIENHADCQIAMLSMRRKDPLVHAPPMFFEYVSSKGESRSNPPTMQTPRRYTYGQ